MVVVSLAGIGEDMVFGGMLKRKGDLVVNFGLDWAVRAILRAGVEAAFITVEGNQRNN